MKYTNSFSYELGCREPSRLFLPILRVPKCPPVLTRKKSPRIPLPLFPIVRRSRTSLNFMQNIPFLHVAGSANGRGLGRDVVSGGHRRDFFFQPKCASGGTHGDSHFRNHKKRPILDP